MRMTLVLSISKRCTQPEANVAGVAAEGIGSEKARHDALQSFLQQALRLALYKSLPKAYLKTQSVILIGNPDSRCNGSELRSCRDYEEKAN